MLRLYITTRNPSPRNPHDFLDQLVVSVTRDARGLGEARIHRRIGDNPGQRVQLDDVGNSEAIHAHVDAAPIPAAQGAVGVEATRSVSRHSDSETPVGGHWKISSGCSRVSQIHFASYPYTGGAPGGSVAKSNPTIGRQRTSTLLPRIATVNSGPGRYVSTNTGWAYRSRRKGTRSASCARDSQTLLTKTPFPDPSATGFTNSG